LLVHVSMVGLVWFTFTV